MSKDEMIQPAETRFTATVPNEEYWRRQIKCQFACPVHTDARGYIRAIAAGDYEEAYLIARIRSPRSADASAVLLARLPAAEDR